MRTLGEGSFVNFEWKESKSDDSQPLLTLKSGMRRLGFIQSEWDPGFAVRVHRGPGVPITYVMEAIVKP